MKNTIEQKAREIADRVAGVYERPTFEDIEIVTLKTAEECLCYGLKVAIRTINNEINRAVTYESASFAGVLIELQNILDGKAELPEVGE